MPLWTATFFFYSCCFFFNKKHVNELWRIFICVPWAVELVHPQPGGKLTLAYRAPSSSTNTRAILLLTSRLSRRRYLEWESYRQNTAWSKLGGFLMSSKWFQVQLQYWTEPWLKRPGEQQHQSYHVNCVHAIQRVRTHSDWGCQGERTFLGSDGLSPWFCCLKDASLKDKILTGGSALTFPFLTYFLLGSSCRQTEKVAEHQTSLPEVVSNFWCTFPPPTPLPRRPQPPTLRRRTGGRRERSFVCWRATRNWWRGLVFLS